MTLMLSELLQCLVECSEKAARIAQVFREENDLFDLLVQEKSEAESNKRFYRDYKTLADVLVQETIKKDVGEKYPDLVAQIRGEEQNSFQNAQDECIEVVITDSMDATTAMLLKVMDGRQSIAEAIANIVHSQDITCEKQYSSSSTYPVNKLGIWIDPIDSTAEFIEGKFDEEDDLHPFGRRLRCACVLIGVYDLETLSPILGVINQPFHSRDSERWTSRFYWGAEGRTSPNIISAPKERSNVVVISASEQADLEEIIRKNYEVVEAAGAGYKALLVAIDKVDLYVLSKGSTYFWDTCAPQAILRSAGGGMLRLKAALHPNDDIFDLDFLEKVQVKYASRSCEIGTEAFKNYEGIIVYKDPDVVLTFLRYLKSNLKDSLS